jgi:dihydrofolate reductase
LKRSNTQLESDAIKAAKAVGGETFFRRDVELTLRHSARLRGQTISHTGEVMRKLKLQMQITIDGFVAGPEGQLDWMTWDMDEDLVSFITHLTDTSDTILLGRKMTDGFIKYWEQVITQPDSPEYSFGQKMVGLPKVVFSKTLSRVAGRNVRVENGPVVDAVNRLKNEAGKDIIVYGGATFVSSLIENGLIDELNLFVNPVAIGTGMRVFSDRRPLRLAGSTAYASGIVVNIYEPRRSA